MKYLLVLVVGFLRDFLASLEIKAITSGRVAQATALAVVVDILWFTLTYVIVTEKTMWLALPSALGNAVATNLATRLKDE